MAADALSQALSARRGKSLDPSLMQGPGPDMAQGNPAAPNVITQGLQNGGPATEVDITIDPSKGQSPSPPVAQGPLDLASGTPLPISQTLQPVGASGEGLQDQLREHVIGHESPGEFEQLKGLKSPSLGQRAKMSAMAEKYEKK